MNYIGISFVYVVDLYDILAIGTISYFTPDLYYLIVMHLLYVIEKRAYVFKE